MALGEMHPSGVLRQVRALCFAPGAEADTGATGIREQANFHEMRGFAVILS